MSLAYGDITSLTAANHFSVEATSATRSLVRRVHNAGGQVLAWTVNSEDSIRRMVDRNVDNIVTDDVALARRCVQESRYSDLLREFLKLLG
jgi:glycerophosphoryl diester phosphodiesterase